MVGSCVELAVRTDGINTPAAAVVELVVTVADCNSDTHRHRHT